MQNAIYFHPRPPVHGDEPYPTRGDPATQNSGSKGVNLENNPQSYGMSAVPMGWQWVSRSETAPSVIPGDLPEVTALPGMGALPGRPYNSPFLVGPTWRTEKIEQMERSAVWASDKDSCSKVRRGQLDRNHLSLKQVVLP
jgi:hypothetical protein